MRDDPVNDPKRLRERIEALESALRRQQAEDVVIEMPRRLKLRAPNGTYFIVTATDAGALQLTNAGTKL